MAKIYPSLGSLQNQVNSPNYGILNAPIFHLPLQNNINPVAGVGTVEFSRSSLGTYIDRFGQVATANIDEPRFEKNGLLMESSSTNMMLYSEDLSKASSWSYSSSLLSITTSTTDTSYLSPSNKSYVYKIMDSNQSGYHSIAQKTAVQPSKIQTVSAFLKLASGSTNFRTVKLTLSNNDSSEFYSVYVDLQTGTIFNDFWTSNVSDINNNIQKIYGDWYRVSLTSKINSNDTISKFEIALVQDTYSSTTGYSYNEIYTGTPGNPNSVYVWGAQLEYNTFASSYIATTNIPVTRAGDYMVADILNTTINYPTNQNTYVLDFDILAPTTYDGSNRVMFTLAGFKYNLMRVNGAGNQYLYYDSVGLSDKTPIESNVLHRTAARYNYGTYGLFRNGFKVAETSSTPYTNSIPTGKLYLGTLLSNTDTLNGHLTNFRIYDAALTDDEIRII